MQPGDQIDSYTIVSEIGGGSMSVVYLATDVTNGAKVVVKQVREQYAFDQQLVGRFLRGATAVKDLRHPHLVRVLKWFEYHGRFYTVEEYLPGGSLADLLKSGTPSETEALTWCRDALKALNYVHEFGIVHGDIKPSNLMLDDNRKIRVIDFGIAPVFGDKRLTRTGDRAIGTAWYMSPEQIRALDEVDHLTDVYATGVVLYELLTGTVPFDGPTDFTVMERIVHQQPPSFATLKPGLDPALEKIVFKAMAKDPKKRFGGSSEFALQLERHLSSRYSRHPLPIVTALSTVRAFGQRATAMAETLKQRSKLVAHTLQRTLSAPRGEPANPVLLGVSAPRQAKPGTTFTARFAAYVQEREDMVFSQLRRLDANPAEGDVQTVVGMPPSRDGRWVVGAPVTVRASGLYLQVNPESQSFEWNGTVNIVSFLVSVTEGAPNATTQLCFEAFIEAIPVAFIPLNVVIGRSSSVEDPVTVTAPPIASAFACYASKDAPVVALLVSALKRWDPHADVFMDCLDLTPNQDWRKELEQLIPSKDMFLLFWSSNASRSRWVAWELEHARSSKGIDWIRPMPIEDPETAPPPDFLRHLHFRDKYLVMSEPFLRRKER